MRIAENNKIPMPEEFPSAEAIWEQVKKSLLDEYPEMEAEHDLEQMRTDNLIHITASVTQHVVCQPESQEVAQIVLPHLCRCAWCRNTLYETLSLCGKEADHLGYALLKTAEEWGLWESAGRSATQEARHFLRSQGVNIIYERDGVVWEERPDGMAHPVNSEDSLEKPFP